MYRLRLAVGSILIALVCLATAARAQTPAQWMVESRDGWKFRTGDDPAWADPAYDDSAWGELRIGEAWTEHGYPGVYGFAWYRRRFPVSPLLDGRPLAVSVLPHSFSAAEVYAGGELVGSFGHVPPDPRISSRRYVALPVPRNAVAPDGTVTVAIRVWHPPETAGSIFGHPGVWGARFGDAEAVATAADADRQDALLGAVPQLVLGVLFLVAGLYHLLLFRSRKSHVEYLWFGLLAAAFALNTLTLTPWVDLAVPDRLLVFRVSSFSSYLCAVLAIQFLWTFLRRPVGPWLRAYQIAELCVGAFALLSPTLRPLWQYGGLFFATVLPAAVAVVWLVVREAWRGNPDARTLAFGGVVVLACEIAEISRRFVPFYVPPVAAYGFAVVVASMVVALSNRYSRVYADLDALNRDLERKVDERTDDLRRANDRLAESERDAREANRAKSVFLSNMSHELRTPLNAIIGFAQVLDRDRALSADHRASVRVVARSGEHLLGLINDVLSIAKIEAGKLSLDERPFGPRETLVAAAAMVEGRAREKGLGLVVDLAPDLPAVARGDEGKLRQILLNLLGNAVKFTSEGEVALRARWADGLATFEVADTGPGIAPEERERLFEAFAQTETGRSSREGTGLGLTISRDLARLMGGDVTVETEPGRGSTFTVTARLAAAEGVPAETGRSVVALAPGSPRPKVLVVDDTPENRAVLAKLLAPVGFEVREASDGAEAIAVCESWRPDAVLMDMRMPVVDGYEATRRIRELEAERGGPRAAIVSLTASAFDHDRDAILAAGCDDYVAKPFRAETLFEKLAERLGVRYAYDAPEDEGADDAPDDAAAVRALPPEIVAALVEAVDLGDVGLAQRALDRVAAVDEPLASRLRALVKAYRFDEVLRIVGETSA